MSYKSNREGIPRPIPPPGDPYAAGFDDKLYEDEIGDAEQFEAEAPYGQFRPAAPEPQSEPSYEPQKKPRRKHRFLKVLLWTLLSLLILKNYNGERGTWKGMKWFFYIYYPAHLFVIGLLRVMLGNGSIFP